MFETSKDNQRGPFFPRRSTKKPRQRIMANPSQTGGEAFDIRRVKRLVELMQENELTELDIQQGDMRIQLKRGGPSASVHPPVYAYSGAPVLPPAPLASVPSAVTPAAVAVPEERNTQIIKSPMVGTFYSAPNPTSGPFVKVGDTIGPETTVCLIEAMKVYNEIQAECSGKIIAVLAKNGATVEYGTPLFKVTAE